MLTFVLCGSGLYFQGDIKDVKPLDLLQEALIMTQLKHPHVLRLIGIMESSLQNRQLMLITEYMVHGALDRYLRRVRYAISANNVYLLEFHCVRIARRFFSFCFIPGGTVYGVSISLTLVPVEHGPRY